MRIAFYAPMKPPSDPVPSGDRMMAGLLVTALQAAGHEVTLVSTLRSFVPEPRPELMRAVVASVAAEAETITAGWSQGARPDLWFTYHPYYKAPDLLGPSLAQRFGLPYATAEASHAGKRRLGLWQAWHAANEAALRLGAVHFCFTPADRAGLGEIADLEGRLVDLPPFIEAAGFSAACLPVRPDGPVELVTVAMMRPGAKARSYDFLAQALARLPDAARWRLTIAGDGSAREDVRRMMAAFPAERIAWRGELGQTGIAAALECADIFVWPGYDEAYGICYLEAGASGLPVLAMLAGGIPSVVQHGETGLLTPEGDVDAYAAALLQLIERRELRRRLGATARRFVREERTVARAAKVLSGGLAHALDRSATLKRASA